MKYHPYKQHMPTYLLGGMCRRKAFKITQYHSRKKITDTASRENIITGTLMAFDDKFTFGFQFKQL
jgi:hypothetical protein